MLLRNILFIAPYADLAQEATQINREFGFNIPILVANLPDAIGLLAVARRQQVDVIVSRGGVALALRELQHDIPVVEVSVTAYDVLEAIHTGSKYGLPMGVAGFANVVYGADRVKSILNLSELQVKEWTQHDECDGIIRRMASEGIQVIIGDTVATQTAQRYGLKSILVQSGKEAILSAYRVADRLVEARRAERGRAQQLRTILDYVQSGVVAVDQSGAITLINPEAARLLGLEPEQVVGRPAKLVIPNSRIHEVLATGEAEIGSLHQMGRTRLVTNRVPILVNGETMGVVATFLEVKQLQDFERRIRHQLTDRGHVAKATFADIVGDGPSLKRVVATAKRYAAVDSVILLRGETGTGKEIFAQSIHNYSPRRGEPFVAVNCAALPPTLLESELFGYVKGAFTDARRDGKMGVFEQAHGGTLLLDEVTEMPPSMQARLLRVLQEREIVRVGDDRVVSVDVRVIATTNRNLEEMVQKGEFRADLYYRLNILNLRLPALRERSGDIPLLISHFLAAHAERYHAQPRRLSVEALHHLSRYHWPGNIRELAAFAERLTVQSSEPVASLDECLDMIPDWEIPRVNPFDLEQMAVEAIKRALQEAQGNKRKAAEILGIDRTTLYRKLKEHRLQALD